MKILYVTRKFPPSVGGLETAAYELQASLKQLADVRLVHYGGSNKLLPLVYPWLFLQALVRGWVNRPDVLYVQDGMLAPMGLLLQWLVRKPCVLSVHGLDITFSKPIYQKMVHFCFPRLAHIVAGGDLTREEIEKRLANPRLSVIPYGVRDTFYQAGSRDALRAQLAEAIGLGSTQLARKSILITTGRLIPRKGAAWFVEHVALDLTAKNPNFIYLIAGQGQDEPRIRQLIAEKQLENNVKLLGYTTNETRNLLYNAADLFIMPNIPLVNDPEGFGLVALEAASCGTPVVGSKLDGIINAVADGKTGQLIPPADAEAYVTVLAREMTNPTLQREAVRAYVLENFSWEKAAGRYLEVFQSVAGKKA